MPDALWSAYPALHDALATLAGGRSWCLTGVSAILTDGADLLLEITKPSHWGSLPDGRLLVGLGAIGGSLEPGETVLGCLDREAGEEIGARLAIESAPCTLLVHEERAVVRVDASLSPGYPLPALFTVSRNLHRRAALPDREVLAIATFVARPLGATVPRDLFGILRIPRNALDSLLARPWAVGQALGIPGVRIILSTERGAMLPADAILQPVWTARSLQVLQAAQRLREVLPA